MRLFRASGLISVSLTRPRLLNTLLADDLNCTVYKVIVFQKYRQWSAQEFWMQCRISVKSIILLLKNEPDWWLNL